MTIIETLVAISILTVSIVAPMSLTMQSLASAYYARDQVIAFNLAQEAIESVRAIRDSNILRIALDQPDPACTPINIMCNIPIDTDFTIDTRVADPATAIQICSGVCPRLQTDPAQSLYGYSAGWSDTPFRRTVRASFVDGALNEIRITVTVTRDGAHTPPAVVLNANLYRWLEDGTGI